MIIYFFIFYISVNCFKCFPQITAMWVRVIQKEKVCRPLRAQGADLSA